MKIAVIPFGGASFEDMFGISEETLDDYNPYHCLRKELHKKGLDLVPASEIYSNECQAVLHYTSILHEDLELLKIPNKIHIYVASEPIIVIPAHAEIVLRLLKKLVYDVVLSPYRNIKSKGIQYIELPRCFPPYVRTDANGKKLACMICRDKYALGTRELYSERRRIICTFEKQRPELFDFYGQGWSEPFSRFQTYKGTIKSKLETAGKYKFEFCLENEYGVGALQEKIFDAMYAGRVPIYQGMQDIESFVPLDCFIDYRNFECTEDCIQYIEHMPEQEYEKYTKNIQDYLSSSHTHERFSPTKMANNIEYAIQLATVKKVRLKSVVLAVRLLQVVYENLCKLKRKKELDAIKVCGPGAM